MAVKWLKKLNIQHPSLAEQAEEINEADNFIIFNEGTPSAKIINKIGEIMKFDIFTPILRN